VQLTPELSALLRSNYVRGAITGLGLINLWASLAELADLVVRRNEDRPTGVSMHHDG
jgi:hypothetical protein